ATTSATAPVAAEIIAGRPPRNATVTAIVNDVNRPTRGSTPAMTEKAIASGTSASPTTSPPSTSVRRVRADRKAARNEPAAGVRGRGRGGVGGGRGAARGGRGRRSAGRGRRLLRRADPGGPAGPGEYVATRLHRDVAASAVGGSGGGGHHGGERDVRVRALEG